MKEEAQWYLFSMKMAEELMINQFKFERLKSELESKHTEKELIDLGYLKTTKTFIDYE